MVEAEKQKLQLIHREGDWGVGGLGGGLGNLKT
jgi:hypothetical protein